jgi:quercetin dioxygenase-like cupin family protein
MSLTRIVLSIVVAVIILAPPVRVLGQPDTAAPFQMEKRFDAETPPAEAEIVHFVLDFQPGVWLPLHTHDGPGYATVIDGAMTRRAEGVEVTLGRGEGWVDHAVLSHQAGNNGGAPARIAATFVQPRGATLTTLVEPSTSPGPTTFAELRFDVQNLPVPLELIHGIADVPPGAQVPPHSHPGPTVVTILRGTGVFMDGTTSRSVFPGAVWLEPADDVHGGTLQASSSVQLLATHFVPRGAAHTVPAARPAPVQLPAPMVR